MKEHNQTRFNKHEKEKGIDFNPSLKTLTRILNSVSEQGPSTKSKLSRKTNLNYTRFASHVVWLEKKGFVESIIHESQINIRLTPTGKMFKESISSS